jgi:hypothetical protein
MSGPIIRLFGLIVVLFALLIGWTSRWTVFEASSLNNNQLNRRTLIDEQRIKRGQIIADDGTVLARSVPAPGQIWTRFYRPARCSRNPSAMRSSNSVAAPDWSARAARSCAACRRAWAPSSASSAARSASVTT